MKNREKYKNELMDAIKNYGNICEFMINHGVSKMFGRDMESFCRETECSSCTTALNLWLDEEYEEPEIDWNNVPVDTLVRVRNRAEDKWFLRYFKEIGDEHLNCRYFTWSGGTTSKTAEGSCTEWKYCELVEDEDEE